MAPTTTRDATSHSPLHPEAIAIAHAFTKKDWKAMRAEIPAWHPRNEGPDDEPSADGEGDKDTTDTGGGDSGGAGGDGEKLGEGGKKAIEAERKRAKAAEDRAKAAEAKVKEFEDRNKSDLDKVTDRATSAEETAQNALRRAVAAEKGLPKELAARLRGSTEEELEADADSLLEHFKPAGDGGKGGKDKDAGDDKSRGDKGRFDGGSKGDGSKGGKRYTEAQIAAMSPAEINANWADVQASMRALKQ